MAKLGTYGIIRFDLELFPHATRTLAPLFLTLGVVGILYGAIVAAVQRNLKRLVAYSSWSIISPLIVAKKLSATALSQQSPFRLMLFTAPNFLSASP